MLSSKEKKALRDKKYYENNKEKIAASKKEYYALNKEKIEKQKKEYNQKNKDRIAAQKAEYYIKNKDKIALYQSLESNKERARMREKERSLTAEYKIKKAIKDKKYRSKPDVKAKNAEYQKNYYKTEHGKSVKQNIAHRRRVRTSKGNVTKEEFISLKQNATHCYWCNSKINKNDLHIDHYMPIAKGGEHSIDNLVVSCAECNMTKKEKDPITFANSIGKLL